jgi:NlpC/P60 family putative phage cell wall peptidase
MRDRIVAAARRWIGTPYRHQAAILGAGCDCLGLVRGVWRELYGSEPMRVPNYRADWRDGRHAGELLEAAEALLVRVPGDVMAGQVILFRLGRTPAPKHCGVAVSPDRLGVIEVNLTDGWRRRLAGTFEFPEL